MRGKVLSFETVSVSHIDSSSYGTRARSPCSGEVRSTYGVLRFKIAPVYVELQFISLTPAPTTGRLFTGALEKS